MAKRTNKSNRRKKPRKQAASRRQSQFVINDWLPSASYLKPMLMIAFLLLLSTAAVQGYRWLMRVDTLPVRHVSVSGDFKYLQPEVLQEKLASEVKGGFFSLDLEQLREELETLPWVYRVALRREWPDRLHVYFEEQTPIARWRKTALLNRYGEIFKPGLDEIQPEGLPQIVGESGREKVLIDDFIRYDQMLSETGLVLARLEEDARQDQHLVLANGMQLALGREGHDKRLVRFTRVFAQTLSTVASQIAALDLRYSNGFSIRWHEPDPQALKRGKGHV
ncbi:MAG TPA: FtsQ-type POTRA domain-containing protein [Chromatiales bacterium]|nr:FtsQ-type POTRA domain-containing protein [Thiotrichales bacterium]HIP69447.1 FtsQ-type POTRA domain-containing protein [Chromatiales bacterium]